MTQGDPLSMMMYAVAVLPLIRSLKDRQKWTQNWYADDSTCASKLPNLKEWYNQLFELGPFFGYFPEPRKTVLVIDPADQSEAQKLFHDKGVTIVHGQNFLRGFIGDGEDTLEFVKTKVHCWIHCVERL